MFEEITAVIIFSNFQLDVSQCFSDIFDMTTEKRVLFVQSRYPWSDCVYLFTFQESIVPPVRGDRCMWNMKHLLQMYRKEKEHWPVSE